jgi:hypothetical protein
MRLFLLTCLLMSGWGMAQSSQPSLADLSKEAREKKAKTEKPAKVITNADLKKYQNAPVSVSKSKPADFEVSSEKPAGAADKTEADKQKELAALKQKVQAAALAYKTAVDTSLVLQLRMNSLNNAYYDEQQESMRGMYEEQLDRTVREIEKNKEDMATREQELDDAKQEARQGGVTEEELNELIGELPKPVSVDQLPGGYDSGVPTSPAATGNSGSSETPATPENPQP